MKITAMLKLARKGDKILFPCDPENPQPVASNIQSRLSGLNNMKITTRLVLGIPSNPPREALAHWEVTVIEPHLEPQSAAKLPTLRLPSEDKAIIADRLYTLGVPKTLISRALSLGQSLQRGIKRLD